VGNNPLGSMAINDSGGMALNKPQTDSHNLALITTATKAKRRVLPTTQ